MTDTTAHQIPDELIAEVAAHPKRFHPRASMGQPILALDGDLRGAHRHPDRTGRMASRRRRPLADIHLRRRWGPLGVRGREPPSLSIRHCMGARRVR